MNIASRSQLSRTATRARCGVIAGTAVLFALLRFADPVVLGQWLPLRTSCGAITGLPCLFCGITRALHLLLQGNVSGALYFNWLAIPIVAAVLLIVALLALELCLRRRILRVHYRLTALGLGKIMLASFALWLVHAYLAVAQHKTELLNPRGPLYHYFVKPP